MADVKISVKLLFFAKSRELTGKKESEALLSQSTSYTQLKRQIVELYPDLQVIADNSVLAVNEVYVDSEDPHAGIRLESGDEVAVIPPISGG